MDLISYAAHDSMILANLCPIGMIFYPLRKKASVTAHKRTSDRVISNREPKSCWMR